MTKATNIIKFLKKIDDIEFFDPGGGHSAQGWKIKSTGAFGSIPLTKHGNFDAAIKDLKKALKDANIDPWFL